MSKLPTLTNLSYLLPSFVAIKNIYQAESNEARCENTELAFMFLVTAFVGSWSYHQCQEQFVCSHNKLPTEHQNFDCTGTVANKLYQLLGSKRDVTYRTIHDLDHFLATMTTILVILNVTPLKHEVKKLFLVILLVCVLLFVLSGSEHMNVIPLLLIIPFVVVFWCYSPPDTREHSVLPNRKTLWGAGSVLMVIATISLHIADEDSYNATHSGWHILSAISATCLMLGSSSDNTLCDAPPFLQKFFRCHKKCV